MSSCVCGAFFMMDSWDELIPERLSFVQGDVDSEDLLPNISRTALYQHFLVRAQRKNLVKKCFANPADLSERKNDDRMFVPRTLSESAYTFGFQVGSINRTKIAQMLPLSTSKSGHVWKSTWSA